MEKEPRTEHSQVSLSLLVTNLTALKNFYYSVSYIHYVRLSQWAAPMILLAFLFHTGGRLLFWYVVTMWRKQNGPLTPIKKKVLPLHVDMLRNKKRTKPYYRSFFTFTKDRCPVDLSNTHSHTFIVISKHSQTAGGLPIVSTLFLGTNIPPKITYNSKFKKKKKGGGLGQATITGQIDKVNPGLFLFKLLGSWEGDGGGIAGKARLQSVVTNYFAFFFFLLVGATISHFNYKGEKAAAASSVWVLYQSTGA